MPASSLHPARLRLLSDKPIAPGRCVIYWMQKDQRAHDNWALIYAMERANTLGLPLVVVFALTDSLRHASLRVYDFMLHGLAETARDLRARGIGFIMRQGSPVVVVPELVAELGGAELVTDESYLRLGRRWREQVAAKVDVKTTAITAHLIVPPAHVSDKMLVGAYVLRPRIHKVLSEFVTDYPDIELLQKWENPQIAGLPDQAVPELLSGLQLSQIPGVVRAPVPGARAASQALDGFLARGLGVYAQRTDPNVPDAQSGLSPYLHFGQISAQRVAYELLTSQAADECPAEAESFLDELVVWRELAANFVYYRPDYDSLGAAPAWAQAQLAKHTQDPREFIYTRNEFEQAATHDALWNAAQQELVRTGKMHNYMRMYWAKKVLEWSETPEAALATCIYLNDRYELDGREPGGYAGILWAVAGLHDRPWFERPVYGQIRYMNANGAARKFDVAAYVQRMGL